MKQLLTTATLVLFYCFAIGQVVEKEMDMSAGEHPGLQVELEVEKKDAEKIWKEYVKPYGKVDWDRKNKEHILFASTIDPISDEQMSVVTRFEQFGSMAKASFWFKSNGAYLNSSDNEETFAKAGSFLQEYIYESKRFLVGKEIKNEEKELKNMEKELKKLRKKNDKLNKELEKAKITIPKKEHEIEVNLQEQEEERVKLDEEGVDYKKVEKQLKKLRKKNDGMHKDLEKAKNEVPKKEKEIEQNIKDQASKKEEIKKQGDVLKALDEKMAAIGKS